MEVYRLLLLDNWVPESPGTRLKREGLTALHPVILVPGIVTGGLELREGKPCAEGLFRKRLWGGNFTEVFKRPLCLLEHLSLYNETGLDPPGIRIRAVPGLVAADYFAPGYFVWAVFVENLAKIGYEGKNMHMAAYDRRRSFQNIYRAPPPMGGGGGPGWCAKHIKAIMNIGPVFLGVPKTISNLFSAETKDVASIRAMDPGVLNSEILGLQTLEHVMRKRYSQASVGDNDTNGSDVKMGFRVKESDKYGRIISFGKETLQLSSSRLPSVDTKASTGIFGCRTNKNTDSSVEERSGLNMMR
ncbi:hypothetical protein Peur_035666 [Populus x canadensis]